MKQLPPGSDTNNHMAYQAYDEPVQQAPTLREFLEVLRRRKAAAIQVFIVVVALGVVLTLMSKPVYRSSAKILVEGKRTMLAINNGNDPMSSLFLPATGSDVATQIEVLRSSLVINKVYKGAGITPGLVALDVRQVGTTDVIELNATSTSMDAAQKFVAALPEIYRNDVRQQRVREVATALEFAKKRLSEESENLRKSEKAFQEFKQKANVVDPESQKKMALEAATSARNELSAAEAEVASLRAQLSTLTAARRSLPSTIEKSVTTTNTQLETLNRNIEDLKSERARKLFLYKPTDDEVRKIDAQISDLQARLARTPQDITEKSREPNPNVAGFETKIADARIALNSAEANLGSLRARATELGANLNRYNPMERQQGQLQRDIINSGSAVENLTKSVDQLTLRQKALEAANDPVTTLEAATYAYKIAPRVERNIILAIALGVLLACGAAMLQESLDDHIRDEDEARRILNTPALGHFPLVEGSQRILLSLPAGIQPNIGQGNWDLSSDSEEPDNKALAERPPRYNRNLLEKFRMLRSNVQFTLINRAYRTIMVTSSMPQEGKSYTASNLAIAMAIDGRRVVLIDADMHRPRMHEAFEVPRQPGLSNVLAGQAKLEDCLYETKIPGLHLLPAGVSPPNPVELLNSPALDALLATLSTRADDVIFDSPPVLATADAQVLASKVDGVLYVMQLGKVPKSSVQRSFELLNQAHANIIGTVFNKMTEGTHSGGYNGYNYGYYGYYSDDHSDESPEGDNDGVELNGKKKHSVIGWSRSNHTEE